MKTKHLSMTAFLAVMHPKINSGHHIQQPL